MPTTVAEKYKGRSYEGGDRATIEYFVFGTDSAADALTAIQGSLDVPTTFMNLVIREPRLKQLADAIWLAEVPYGRADLDEDDPDNPEPTVLDVSYEISTETQRIKQAIATVAKYPPDTDPSPAADFEGAIGVSQTPHGVSVEGVDILFPTTSFTIALRGSLAFFTDAYLEAAEQLVGTVCNHAFLGRPVGEMLLVGFTGRAQFGQQYEYELGLRFARRKNETGLAIGAFSVDKRGWDYLWILPELEEDTAKKVLVPRARAVYVEQVYRYASWAPLGAWAVP